MLLITCISDTQHTTQLKDSWLLKACCSWYFIVKYFFVFGRKWRVFSFLFFGRKRKFIFRLFLFHCRKSKIHFRSASTGGVIDFGTANIVIIRCNVPVMVFTNIGAFCMVISGNKTRSQAVARIADWWSFGTESLNPAVFEILHHKHIGVTSSNFQGHVTSSVTWPFDSPYTIFY